MVEKIIESEAQRAKALDILTQFKASNPWRGTLGLRIDKFTFLFNELAKNYNLNLGLRFNINADVKKWYSSASSYYNPQAQVIVLEGRLSVITLLHEVGHAIWGSDEGKAQAWATILFNTTFPEKLNKLESKENGRFITKKKIHSQQNTSGTDHKSLLRLESGAAVRFSSSGMSDSADTHVKK